MPTHNMTGFVGQNADDLVGSRRLHQGANIDEDAVSIHHEGVETFVLDDDNVDVLIAQTGNAKDRRRIIAQELFDFGIANHRNASIGAGLRTRWEARESDGGRGERCDGSHRWPPPPRLARRLSNHHVRLNRIVPSATYGADG